MSIVILIIQLFGLSCLIIGVLISLNSIRTPNIEENNKIKNTEVVTQPKRNHLIDALKIETLPQKIIQSNTKLYLDSNRYDLSTITSPIKNKKTMYILPLYDNLFSDVLDIIQKTIYEKRKSIDIILDSRYTNWLEQTKESDISVIQFIQQINEYSKEIDIRFYTKKASY